MLLLTATGFLLFCLYYLVLIDRRVTYLQRSCAACFMAIFTLSYAPQVSSVVFSTLNLWVLLLASFALPCFLLFFADIPRLQSRLKTHVGGVSTLPVGFVWEIRQSGYLSALGVLAIVATAVIVWVLTRFSNFGWDGWAYHSTAMAWFAQQDSITGSMSLMPWISCYPKNLEFLSLWIQKFTDDDQFIEAANLALHLLAIPFAYGIARYCNLSRHWAVAVALIYFLTPEILSQSWSTLIDGAFADSVIILVYLILSWHASSADEQLFWSVLVGLAVGYVMQSKGVGLHIAVIVLLLLCIRVFLEADFGRFGVRLSMIVLFAGLAGTGWYLKNWLVYGNPIYPFKVTLPGSHITLFPGYDLQRLVEPSSSANYRELSWSWLYLSHFAGVPYAPGWGAHFFFLGLPAMAITMFQNRNLTWLVLFAIAYFVIVPFSFESRYSLAPCIAGAVAFGYMCQELLDRKPWKVTLKGISLATIGISLTAALRILTNQSTNVAESDFAQREGFKRFAVVAQQPKARVGIVNLGYGADNPYWYFYFGHRWQNKVEMFDARQIGAYDYVVCDIAVATCPKLSSYSLAIQEKTVAVYKRNG